MSLWQRITEGAFNKDKSLTTGIVLAFMAWSLMRIVDGINAYNTIEYDITQKAVKLADERDGYLYRVKLTNLAGDKTLKSLQVTVGSQNSDIEFSTDPRDSHCVVQPPAWGNALNCEPKASGFNFVSPPVVAGTFVGFELKYLRKAGSSEEPVLRILPEVGQDFRLVEAGAGTFAARHQTGILLTMFLVGLLLLCLSLAMGITGQSSPKT
jgi:hypothetical protein